MRLELPPHRVGRLFTARDEHARILPDERFAVDDLIRSIDPDQAEAFVLTQELGLSYDEAAEMCRCPVGTIRSRVARARSSLADLVLAAEAG